MERMVLPQVNAVGEPLEAMPTCPGCRQALLQMSDPGFAHCDLCGFSYVVPIRFVYNSAYGSLATNCYMEHTTDRTGAHDPVYGGRYFVGESMSPKMANLIAELLGGQIVQTVPWTKDGDPTKPPQKIR